MKDIEFPKPKPRKVVEVLRDRHHRIARLLATGIRPGRVAEMCGYTIGRISVLQADPAFQELLNLYRKNVQEHFKEAADPFIEVLISNKMKAEFLLADKLDEAIENNESLPTRDLIAISRDAADRTGYGKKQTNVNVNVDFAAQLEKTIQRSTRQLDSQSASRVIELSPASTIRRRA